MAESQLISIADIRKATGKPEHVINHALKRHGPEPVGRIGIARVWRRDQLSDIELSLSQTSKQRSGESANA